ncbi:MAG: HD domain-containing protein [Halanaerobiaceae bacterium]
MIERLKRQLEFIREIDKVKEIFRHTKLFNGSRVENDAEHSWHLAVMAIILAEYAKEPIEIDKVIKMVLIHDIVEIDAGDYIVYTDLRDEKEEKERKAAERIFGILPEEQKMEYLNLWEEFEKRETAEAKFAAALDRLEPLLQNYYNKGGSWQKYKISFEQIYEGNKHIEEGSTILWEYVQDMLEECKEKGFITE